MHPQGRALLDRDPSTFSYVLDYLRNGGTLPPLLQDDEQLLRSIRAEFDYFCFIPNPVDDSRTWVEKLREGNYTAEVLDHVQLPGVYFQDNQGQDVLNVESNWVFFSDECDYMAVRVWVTKRKDIEDHHEMVAHRYGLWGVDLSSPGSAYELVSFPPCRDSLHGLVGYGYEAAFSNVEGEVRIVDIRRDHTSNLVHTLPLGGRVEEFDEIALSTTHVAAEYLAGRDSFVVVWDRLSGHVVAKIGKVLLFPKFLGSLLLLAGEPQLPEVVAPRSGVLTVRDVADPAVTLVRMCPGIRLHIPQYHFTATAVIHFSGPLGTHMYDSATVYSLRDGQKVREMGFSPPLTYRQLESARVVGDTLFVADSNGTLTSVLCVDLNTDESRSVRLGLCERLKDVHLSADARRIVVYRDRSAGRAWLGDIAVYSL